MNTEHSQEHMIELHAVFANFAHEYTRDPEKAIALAMLCLLDAESVKARVKFARDTIRILESKGLLPVPVESDISIRAWADTLGKHGIRDSLDEERLSVDKVHAVLRHPIGPQILHDAIIKFNDGLVSKFEEMTSNKSNDSRANETFPSLVQRVVLDSVESQHLSSIESVENLKATPISLDRFNSIKVERGMDHVVMLGNGEEESIDRKDLSKTFALKDFEWSDSKIPPDEFFAGSIEIGFRRSQAGRFLLFEFRGCTLPNATTLRLKLFLPQLLDIPLFEVSGQQGQTAIVQSVDADSADDFVGARLELELLIPMTSSGNVASYLGSIFLK